MIQELFDINHIILDIKINNQQDAFKHLADLAQKLGCVDRAEDLVKGFEAREAESSTGFEDGFAIPHARIDEVKKAAILMMRMSSPIDWKAMDGKPTSVAIALVIPAGKAADIHLSILSDVARRLIDPSFRQALKTETSKAKIVELLCSEEAKAKAKAKADAKATVGQKEVDTDKGKKLILAMTACPVGVAHTFLAADKLAETGPKMGYDIKVETHGSDGVKNVFTDDEIKRASVIIAAADIGIEMDRFGGKKVYNCGVSRAIKEPEAVINDAFKLGEIQKVGDFKTAGQDNSAQKIGVMKHLMAGVSYMVPIVILGGIFIAISIGLSKAIYGPQYDIGKHNDNFLYYLNVLGGAAFTLMIPILGGFIANSIAGRAALAPALVVSFIGNTTADFYPLPGISAVDTPTGFIGAIITGLAVGYTVKWINTWNVPKSLRPVMPIFFIPIVVGFIYGLIMMFVIGSCVGWVMHQFEWWIKASWNTDTAGNAAVGLGFGILIGIMAGFDMGGPINKVAFLACTGLISNGVYTPMGAMACAIPVAPLGMGLTTWIFRPLFNEEQKTMGSAGFFMGCIGISEGAIPFAVNDPKRVIPCNIVGSLIAGGVAGVIGISDVAGHGGPIVGLLSALGRGNDLQEVGWGTAWGWTLLAFVIMFAGALITCFMYGTWLVIDKKRKGEDISLKQFIVKRKSGEGTFATLKRDREARKNQLEDKAKKASK